MDLLEKRGPGGHRFKPVCWQASVHKDPYSLALISLKRADYYHSGVIFSHASDMALGMAMSICLSVR